MSTDLTTRQLWDTKHAAFRQRTWAKRLRNWLTRDVDRMLARMIDATGQTHGDAIELGCAPGTILERVARVRPQYRFHGIDFSQEGLDATRGRFARLGVPVQLHRGDFREVRLPLRYDLVFSCGVIEHFQDPAEVLACHRTMAKPGGVVAASVPNFAHPRVRALIRRFHPELETTHNFEIMSQGAIERSFQAAGLREIVVGEVGGPRVPSVRPAGRLGAAYVYCALAWNVIASLKSGWLWPTYFYGLGRV